jgi:hypothetical protein
MDVDVAEPVRLSGSVAADQIDREDPFVLGKQFPRPPDHHGVPLVLGLHRHTIGRRTPRPWARGWDAVRRDPEHEAGAVVRRELGDEAGFVGRRR